MLPPPLAASMTGEGERFRGVLEPSRMATCARAHVLGWRGSTGAEYRMIRAENGGIGAHPATAMTKSCMRPEKGTPRWTVLCTRLKVAVQSIP
jgi:hypothetical protein